jgi:hypothetical protein
MTATALIASLSVFGAETQTDNSAKQAWAVPKGWVRLSPTDEVWVDAKHKQVIVGGKICFRKGLLEMFACPKGTKEHESVIAVNSKAYLVHTGLLAIGAKPGTPVRFQPEYAAATGMPIQVVVEWQTPDGKVVRRKAQQMVRHVRTRKPLQEDWIFAGSGFWEDETTGKKFYQAEGGELICVSNFSTAMLDLPVESSQANSNLLFEALTDNIPELGTDVRLILSVKKTREEPAPQ